MIYVASKTKHAEMWKQHRGVGRRIISTWIDEAGENETESFTKLWFRIQFEIYSCSMLLLYAEPDDFPLKGALVEVGMALAYGKPVRCFLPGVNLDGRTMRPVGSWLEHPGVSRVTCLTWDP